MSNPRGPGPVDAPDNDVRLIHNLRLLAHTVHMLYEGKGSQKRVLIMLLDTGVITQRALTEQLGIQPGSASEVMGKLESAGLITRTPSAQDRRTADIALTPAGEEAARQVQAQRQARHREMFSCLSAQEKEVMLLLMERLNADWDARYRAAGRPPEGESRPEKSKKEEKREAEEI